MFRRHRSVLAALAVSVPLLLVLGCANPADGKPEAEVSDPAPVPETVAEGHRYVFVPAESTLSFTGSKVTGSHEGGFEQFDGTIELVEGEPTASRVTIEIDTTSLWADDDRLTKHLKSPDFFDVATFPTATFESTSIEAGAEGYTVTGNLTLHGVTKSVSFPAQIEVGPESVAAQAEFFIKRFDFDIVYPGKPDDLIRDEVVIRFDVVAALAGDEQPTM